MIFIIINFIMNLVLASLFVWYYYRNKKVNSIEKLIDVEKKLEVLIRVIAQHDIFIDGIKDRAKEIDVRVRRSVR